MTKYENNNGSTENVSFFFFFKKTLISRTKHLCQCLDIPGDKLSERSVDDLDIAFDNLSSPKHYKEEEDPKLFKSIKTSN